MVGHQRGQVDFPGVAHKTDKVGGVVETRGEFLAEVLVNFDGNHIPRVLHEASSQDSASGADLHHGVGGTEVGGVDDALNHAGIVEEVLSQRLARSGGARSRVQKAPATGEYTGLRCIGL